MATEVLKRPRREASTSAETLVDAENAFLADTDIYESDDALFVRLDVPGVEKGNVSVEVDEANTLQVRAKSSFQEPKGVLIREFFPGDFYRSFRLRDVYNKEKIAAKLENGILEITIPKLEAVKPKLIEISA